MVQPLGRTIWKFLKLELPDDSVIPFLGIYLEKNMTQKDTCIPMFTAALFTIAKTETTQMSIHRGMGKEDVVHLHNGILLSH